MWVFVMGSRRTRISEHFVVEGTVAKASARNSCYSFRVAKIMPEAAAWHNFWEKLLAGCASLPLDKHLNSLTDRVKQLLANQGQPAARRGGSHDFQNRTLLHRIESIGWITGAGFGRGVIEVLAFWCETKGRPIRSARIFGTKSMLSSI